MEEHALDISKKEYTDSFLTRQGKKILFLILQNPGICSSSLADIMGIKKNSMSNALDRLKNSKYALIYSEAQGRQKCYFLTEWGMDYTSRYLNLAEAETKKISIGDSAGLYMPENAGSAKKKAEEIIEDLKLLSSEWEFELFDFLWGAADGRNGEICQLSGEFLQQLQELYTNENGDEFQQVMDHIKSSKVRQKLTDHLESQCGLLPLWDWAEEDWEGAYGFIDELFDEQKLILAYRFTNRFKKYEISETLYRQIIMCIMKIVDTARADKLGKRDFYERIIETNPQCDQRFAYYIAEKYRELENEMKK